MTIGYVLKAQYFLPFNASHLNLWKENMWHKSPYFEKGKDINVRSIESDSDILRWTAYHSLDFLIRKMIKTDGKQCILRYICEASQVPFGYKNGILGEILHILLV